MLCPSGRPTKKKNHGPFEDLGRCLMWLLIQTSQSHFSPIIKHCLWVFYRQRSTTFLKSRKLKLKSHVVWPVLVVLIHIPALRLGTLPEGVGANGGGSDSSATQRLPPQRWPIKTEPSIFVT